MVIFSLSPLRARNGRAITLEREPSKKKAKNNNISSYVLLPDQRLVHPAVLGSNHSYFHRHYQRQEMKNQAKVRPADTRDFLL
jgi:hypothetical protein